MTTTFRPTYLWAALLASGFPGFSCALVSMDDEGLSSVTGQDGWTVTLTAPATGNSATAINTRLDAGLPTEGLLSMEGFSLKGVDTAGVLTNSPFNLVSTLDVGASSAAGDAYVKLDLRLDRARLRVNDLRIGSASNRSLGTMAIDGDAAITLAGRGFFNNSATDTYLYGELGKPLVAGSTDGTARMFYRQLWHEHPYLVMNNLHALWEMPAGTLGVTADGIRMETAGIINIALDYDMLYKFPVHYPTSPGVAQPEFTITGQERPLMHMGWLGALKQASLLWQPKGVGTGYDASGNFTGTNAGLTLSSRWNFVSKADAAALGDAGKEFRWQLGEAASTTADKSRINFELGDWTAWRGNAWAHDFPMIAMDVIKPGNLYGAGGLCWGGSVNSFSGTCANGQYVALTPGEIQNFDPDNYGSGSPTKTDASALALMVRKGNLLSYSRSIRLLERDASGALVNLVGGKPREFNWGLIYTLANIDANIYLYPGGNPSDDARVPSGGGASLNNGIIADIALMMQTFDNAAPTKRGPNWDKGFHLMIADTAAGKDDVGGNPVGMGIGLIDSNLLLLANDTRIWLRPHWDANDFYAAGIDLLSKQTRLQLITTFGGGELADPSGSTAKVIRATHINLNVEGLVNLRISPSHPDSANPVSTYNVGARNFLGFSGAIRFMDTDIAGFSESVNGTVDDGSFLSLAEPNRPDVDVRLANVTGDLALTNGRIDMRGTTEDGDGKPKLVISQNILLGAAAADRMNNAVVGSTLPGAAAGQAFTVGTVKLGGSNLGTIVIPQATIYQSIALKPIN